MEAELVCEQGHQEGEQQHGLRRVATELEQVPQPVRADEGNPTKPAPELMRKEPSAEDRDEQEEGGRLGEDEGDVRCVGRPLSRGDRHEDGHQGQGRDVVEQGGGHDPGCYRRILKPLALERDHGQRDRGRRHRQAAHDGDIGVVPEIVCEKVGSREGRDGPEEGDAPASSGADQEAVRALLKSEGKHDQDDSQLGHPGDEGIAHARNHVGVHEKGTEREEPEHRRRAGLARGHVGDEDRRPDQGEIAKRTHGRQGKRIAPCGGRLSGATLLRSFPKMIAGRILRTDR